MPAIGDDVAIASDPSWGARALFLLTAGYGGLIVWLAPHPPMIDLPQHAGQIATLRDLLAGRSPWTALLRINVLTPYLIGYVLALPLLPFMPVVAAMKVVLTGAYWAFVAACVALRKSFGSDARLDWLFIPPFFGFAYKWGLYPFLVAAPLGLLFILLARRYASAPAPRSGVLLCVVGTALFFGHALAFLFGSAVGALLLVTQSRSARLRVRALAPYAFLALLCAIYFLAMHRADLQFGTLEQDDLVWKWDWNRPAKALVYVLGTNDDVAFVPAACVFLALPFLLGDRLDRNAATWMPLAVVAAIFAAVPSFAFKSAFVFERFALVILPCWALVFRRGETRPATARRVPRSLPVALVAATCWTYLAVLSVRAVRFGEETRDFESVLKAAQPGRLALAIIDTPASAAARSSGGYAHWVAWYQAEKGGFVEPNFARARHQVVRYRADRLPALPDGFHWAADAVDWNDVQAYRYDYVFVRHAAPLPPRLFRNQGCELTTVAHAGAWSLYERGACGGRDVTSLR